LRLQFDSRCMLRKALAGLLVLSWVLLSGLDVLEDLDFSNQVKLHRSTKAAGSSVGQVSRLTNNIIESAYHSDAYYETVLKRFIAQQSAAAYTTTHKKVQAS
jgi:hypothetical protein